MGLHSARALAIVALVYVVYALLLKLRWKILHAMIGLLWGWLIFSLLSYLYHHDHTRAIDLLRTFFLRFTPLTLAASVLVTTTRPTDVVRLLRKLYIPGFVLLPLASVIRSLPQSRREFHQAVHQLKTDGTWTHWSSPLRKPHIIARRLISPQIHKWSTQLADEDQSPSRA
jgi:energy-coupling factor transporter transmembrane protein EcfT